MRKHSCLPQSFKSTIIARNAYNLYKDLIGFKLTVAFFDRTFRLKDWHNPNIKSTFLSGKKIYFTSKIKRIFQGSYDPELLTSVSTYHCSFITSKFYRPISNTQLNIPSNILLTDSKFNIPFEIDTLIGMKTFFMLLCIDQISIRLITKQKMKVGWKIEHRQNQQNSRQFIASQHSIQLHSKQIDKVLRIGRSHIIGRGTSMRMSIRTTIRNHIVQLSFNAQSPILDVLSC